MGGPAIRLPRKGDFETFAAWRSRGASIRAATAATEAGCKTAEDVLSAGYKYFASQPNCGRRTLAELDVIAGGWSDAPRSMGICLTSVPVALLVEEIARRVRTIEKEVQQVES